jgi:hypothetical protein
MPMGEEGAPSSSWKRAKALFMLIQSLNDNFCRVLWPSDVPLQ